MSTRPIATVQPTDISTSTPFPLFASTFPGTPTSTSAAVTSTEGPEPSLTSSAALYLYTFLATLVLLLAVSSAIVIRSLILRRRHQRIVEEAIRAGTWLPNQPYEPRGTRRRRDIGRKPKLWEAWLRSGEEAEAEEPGKSKCAWDDIMPVYAAHIKSAPIPRAGAEKEEEESSQIRTDADADASSSRTMRFLRPFRTPFSPPKSSPIVPHTPPSSPLVSAPPAVSVAVLIAMPTPRHPNPNPNSRETDGPPVIELGVVNVPLRDMDMGESGEKS